MLIGLFYITSFVLLLVIINQKRITKSTIFGLGTILYGIPLFFGYTTFRLNYSSPNSYYFSEIDINVYVIFILAQFVFFFASISERTQIEERARGNEIFFLSSIICVVFYLFMFVYTTGIDNLSIVRKVDRLQHYTVFYNLTLTLSTSIIIYFLLYKINRFKYLILIPILVLIVDLLMGNRDYFFLCIISLVVIYFAFPGKVLNIKNKIKWGLLGIIVILAAFLSKPIINDMRRDMFSFQQLPSYFKESIIGSEPFAIISVLNEIIKQGVSIPSDYFFNNILQHLPFYQSLTGEVRGTFNSYFQNQLFPSADFGLASNSLGELYTIGSYFAIITFFVALYLFLRMKSPKFPLLKVLYYFLLPYIVFYFYRNDYIHFLSYAKYYFISFIGVILLTYYLQLIVNGAKRNRGSVNRYEKPFT